MAVEIFYGGGVNLGRRMHGSSRAPFGNITTMRDADLRIVNLIGLVTPFDEPAPMYARPEMINVLTGAGIDVVITGNRQALSDQNRLLDQAGIIHVDDRPVLIRVVDQTIALLPVDIADENFSDIASKRIADLRKQADTIFIAVDWNPAADKYFDETREFARALLDCGADAVLGNHSRLLTRVEKHNERPIIYAAGFLLHDEPGEKDSGCYLLTVDRDGVKHVEFTALRRRECYTVPATVSKERINNAFLANAKKIGTDVTINDKGIIEIDFAPPTRGGEDISRPNFQYADEHSDVLTPIEVSSLIHMLIKPLSEPRPEWTVERVPEDAIIRPQHFGALTLLGWRVEPERLTRRQPILVETFWSIEQPIDRSYRLSLRAEPERECKMGAWGENSRHEFCNWQFPTNRWKAGVIYRERFAMMPPPRGNLLNIDLQLTVEVFDGNQSLGKYSAPTGIDVHFPNTSYIKKEYPASVYEWHPNRLWTAQQIVDVTDGEWIVPPPEGWFAQSVICNFGYMQNTYWKTPVLFAPPDSFWTSARWKGTLPAKVGGLIVSERRNDVPPEMPQLKVSRPYSAVFELGVAAYRRFQGKVIAVTGSSGKTTTQSMIYHILSEKLLCSRTFLNKNTIWVPIIAANVLPNAAFAIFEMASEAFVMSRGPITYEITPDIAVVTSISHAHIAVHGSIEGVVETKSKVLCGMKPGGYAILNRDMEFYDAFESKARAAKLNIITFGTHPEARIRMTELVSGSTFTFGGKEYVLECTGPAVQLYDALAAIGVSFAVGFSIEEALERLKSFSPVSQRGNLIKVNRGGKNLRLIDSTYNANLGSMSGDLRYLKEIEQNAGHRVAVLGDITELAQESIPIHRKLKDVVLESQADRVLLCGEYMKYLWEDIKDAVNARHFAQLEDLINEIDGCLRDGDTVLIKSSHATHLDRVVKYLKSTVVASD